MSFANVVKNYNTNAPARTENGMKAHATSASAVLDLFGKIGSARGVDLSPAFFAALGEDQDLAIRILMWARDIRAGSGERQTFRTLLSALEKVNPALAGRLMHKVPFLGRWDDLFAYADPLNKTAAYNMIRAALDAGDGLAAKWMPRKGAIAVELTNHFRMSPKQYRKTIVGLTTVVETQMCAKNWNEINFSHVPSLASARYQKAFGRNASEAYSKYIRELQKPEAERDPKVKINAGAVYPYDVVKSVGLGNPAVANEQWKALPNYVGDARIFPMVDVSGSMGSITSHYGNGPSPMMVAVSLGLYLSDKNTGPFKDLFLTFSEKPEILNLKGDLTQKMRQMMTSNWGMNTNLHAAFDHLLDVAMRGRVKTEDMPQALLILSDMQFDSCARFDDRAKEMIARKYEAAGYPMPRIIFWNLNAGYASTPVRFDDRGVCHVSGFSPAIMKSVLANDLEEFTPYSIMMKTISNPRYDY
jgi:Domain of unknown function (DUF2828)